jgi:hypothetical protein
VRGQHPSDAIEGHADKGKKGDQDGFLWGRATLVGGLRAHYICWLLQPFFLKMALRNFTSACRLLWSVRILATIF